MGKEIYSDIKYALLFVLVIGSIYFGPRTPVLAQSNVGKPVHVSGVALPASLGSPSSIEGYPLSSNSVNVDMIVIANTDTSSHTVTVQDCTASTPFVLFNAYPIAASTTWTVPMGSTRFTGCFKWSANSTLVLGTMTGTR